MNLKMIIHFCITIFQQTSDTSRWWTPRWWREASWWSASCSCWSCTSWLDTWRTSDCQVPCQVLHLLRRQERVIKSFQLTTTERWPLVRPDGVGSDEEGRLHLLTPGVGEDLHVLGGPPQDGDDPVVGGGHDEHRDEEDHHHLVGGDHNTEHWPIDWPGINDYLINSIFYFEFFHSILFYFDFLKPILVCCRLILALLPVRIHPTGKYWQIQPEEGRKGTML